MKPPNQRGAVLLLVLVIVALLSAILTDWAFSTLVDLRLTETYRDSSRAYYLARGGIEVGRQMLLEDRNDYDAPGEMWEVGVPAYPVSDDATVTIRIIDEDGRFNLNQIVDAIGENPNPVPRDRLRRLLTNLGCDDPDALVEALIDWIDRNDAISARGAENGWYQGLQPAMVAKNGPLDTIDELLLVKGFTPEVVEKLTPLVTVAGVTSLNLNTAPEALLTAWDTDVSPEGIALLMQTRQEKPFKSLQDVQSAFGSGNQDYSALSRNGDVGVKSQFYRITAEAQVGDGMRSVEALIQKSANKLLWRRVY